MTVEHKDAAINKRHAPHNWEYADETAREAATGFTADDVGKLARQLDDNSLWMLTDDSPATWQEVGGGGTPSGGDTYVQFNDGGAFGGDAGLTYNKTTDTLTVGAKVVTTTIGTPSSDMAIAIGGVTPFGISASQIYPQSANKDLGAAGGFEFRFLYTITVSLKPVAFASLPASPAEGMMAWVNDSTTAVYGATVAGGGSNKVLVVHDGANWKVH
jgi:hypothetical protein